MQTHKITLTYPTSGLTVNVEIRNRTTNVVYETGVAVENGTTATYDYDFDGADNTDYIYIASVSGLNDIKGAVFYEAASGGGGGATVADIWGAQITDYSDTVGSFANKFASYGGVSHVIEKIGSSGLDDEDKKLFTELATQISEMEKKIAQLSTIEPKYIESTREIVKVVNIPAPKNDTDTTTKILVKGLKELNTTLSGIIVKGLSEIKNNK